MKIDKSLFSDISWPLTSFIFFFCAGYWNRLIALMQLFSLGRTVFAGLTKLWSPVATEKYRMTIIVLRTSVMVWYTWRSPWTVFSRTASRPGDARPASRLINYKRYKCMIVECENDFKSSRDTYSLDKYTDSPPESIHSVFGSNRPRTVQTNCLQSTRYQIVWTVQLPDHPPHFYSPRQLFFLGDNLSNSHLCIWYNHISRTT